MIVNDKRRRLRAPAAAAAAASSENARHLRAKLHANTEPDVLAPRTDRIRDPSRRGAPGIAKEFVLKRILGAEKQAEREKAVLPFSGDVFRREITKTAWPREG